MFSFRVSPLLEQEDLALTKGKIGIICDQTAWDPLTGSYIWEHFKKKGRLAYLYKVDNELLQSNIEIHQLKEIDALIIELQDTGSRYSKILHTIYSLFSILHNNNIPLPIYIVDRVNPGGRQVEGTQLKAGYRSAIGLEGIPHRHGLTLGEMANYFYNKLNAKFPLHVISYKASLINKVMMPWSIPPAENYAGLFTPNFFSGQYLWEGTNVSCGIGTTRPYEIFGAPFFSELQDYNKEIGRDNWNNPNNPIYDDGVKLRWCEFFPRYNKWAGIKCYGFQLLLNPNYQYHSLAHSLRIMNFIYKNCSSFSFVNKTTSENEAIEIDKKEIELLLGDKELIDYVKGYSNWEDVKEHIKLEEQKWIKKTKKIILYEEETLFRIK